MKNKFKLLIIIASIAGMNISCQKYFLEKPETSGTVNLEEVYSSTRNAEATLFSAYRSTLIHGWPGGWGGWHGALGSLSGERSRGWGWHATYAIVESGLRTTELGGSPAGADDFFATWSCIRGAFLIKENIDRVPDMSEQMKQYIKAEATALVAYRYMGMFYRYGGVPIVTKAFLPLDEMNLPRATLQETLDYILALCDEAIAGLPDSWPSQHYGRFTKGAAMAIKARTLQFAARPLFNSSTPYLPFGEQNNRICFGNEDDNRWQKAIEAHEAVLTWANSNGYTLINTGGAGTGIPNPNALNDYGTATSVSGNKEVLLAYKLDKNMNRICIYYNASENLSNYGWETELVGLISNFLENYYTRNGTEPVWPKIGDPAPLPASHWINNVENMEARFRLDYVVPGVGTLNNPGEPSWTIGAGWGKWIGNYSWENKFPAAVGDGRGCGAPAKFYYKAGTRQWFEPPLFRMAETHLSLAEAYNEVGNTVKALEHLNAVHNRAGLPSITETDKSKLRRLIWREKAIEMVGENHRYFDVKHWKHPDIGNGIIGGQFRELQFQVQGSQPNFRENLVNYWNANTVMGYWHPKMYLEPFPQIEVNKGTIVQNPGY
ncbi:MAG TPA: RagB/SusD family nutrient uptake outer membrane protein [Niabella sp.]|nr:RagB/SusD family nutrient uptake outer membrane protein [Niabella sp.]